jgi:hypothetical protein
MTLLRTPHRRLVPPEWERQLAELSPPNNRFPYLKLVWEPGRPDAVIERYVIYWMIPECRITPGTFDAEQLEQLQRDTPPQGYYDAVKEEYVDEENCLITTRMWHLYRETKCLGKLFWVVQGAHGGHLRWFSANERTALRMQNLPDEPPLPGELPYAEFDQRTISALTKYFVLKGVHDSLKRMKELSPEAYAAHKAEEEKAFRAHLASWVSEQVADMTGGVSLREPDERAENAQENFIETGRTHHGARLSIV